MSMTSVYPSVLQKPNRIVNPVILNSTTEEQWNMTYPTPRIMSRYLSRGWASYPTVGFKFNAIRLESVFYVFKRVSCYDGLALGENTIE